MSPLVTEKIGIVIVVFFVASALFAARISPYSRNELSGEPFEEPSIKHLLGTNDLGYDNLSEIIYGSKASIKVGIIVGIISTFFSILLGTMSAYPGSPWDKILMRFLDILLAIPSLPLIIVLTSFLGADLYSIIVILSFISSTHGIRVIRSQAISIKERDYVLAAKSMGAGSMYIIFRHIMPGVFALGIPKFVLTANQAIITESGLAFLGIGDVSQKSWGMIIHFAHSYPETYFSSLWMWWLMPPILCLVLLVLGLTFMGNFLERKFNPKKVKLGFYTK